MPVPIHHMSFKKRRILLSLPSVGVTLGKVSSITPRTFIPFALLHSLMLPTRFPTAEGQVGAHPEEEEGTAHPKITLISFCRAAEAREAPGPCASSSPPSVGRFHQPHHLLSMHTTVLLKSPREGALSIQQVEKLRFVTKTTSGCVFVSL